MLIATTHSAQFVYIFLELRTTLMFSVSFRSFNRSFNLNISV